MKLLSRRKGKDEVEKLNVKATDNAKATKDNAKPAKSGSNPRTSNKNQMIEPRQEVDDDERSALSWWPMADNVEDDADAATEYSSSVGGTWSEKAYGQKQVVYTHFGDFPKEVLEIQQVLKPTIENPTDVIIKVEASSVTINDCLLRRGICFDIFDPVCLPATPGSDVVGTIKEIGSSVPGQWKRGDRVAALIRTGGNARYAVVPSSSLVHVPENLDAADAVCMVSIYMTAYQSLKMTLTLEEKKGAKPLEGKKILVVGGAGPVGQALVNLSLKAGAAEVYATGPKDRHKYMKSVMGAKPLGYEPEEWLPKVKGEMDYVFDGSCQDGYNSSHEALKANGKLVTVGMVALLNREEPGLFGAPLSAFMTDAKAALFMSQTQKYELWSSFQNDPETFKNDLLKLFGKLKKNQIRPRIAKRVGLDGVAEAHMFLEMDKARGPVVCIPWKSKHCKDVNVRDNVREKPEEVIEEKPKKHRNLFGARDKPVKDLGTEEAQSKKTKGSAGGPEKERDKKSRSRKSADV